MPVDRVEESPLNRHRPIAARLVLLAALASGAIVPAHSALAQNIPDQVVTGAAADTSAVRALVDQHKSGLTGDSATIRRSRNALIEPLRRTGVSPSAAFRNEMSSQLRPVLDPLVGDKRDEVAINALRVAGELGSKDGLQLITRGLGDARASVRIMAAMAFARTAGVMGAGNRALTEFTFEGEGLTPLVAALDKETDPKVLVAMVSALDATMAIPQDKVPDVGMKASDLLISAVAKRTKGGNMNGALAPMFSQATKSLFDQLTAGAPATQARKAGGTVRDVLGWADKALVEGISEELRAELSLVATQCETLAGTAMGRVGGKLKKSYGLGQLISSGNDAAFRRAAAELIDELRAEPMALK